MTSSAAAGGPCCAWTDFIQPVRERWHPEWGTLDEDHARTAWHRYSATSGEYLNSAQAGKLEAADSVANRLIRENAELRKGEGE